VLPLLGVRHRTDWPDQLDLDGMASFNLVLAEPEALRWWWFDGTSLQSQQLEPGTYKFTVRGLADEMDPRLLHGRGVEAEIENGTTENVWPEWLSVVRGTVPSSDPAGFVVRIAIEDKVFETVFGQFLATRPGRLRLDYLTSPASGTDREWSTERFTRPGD
jgi:hypothetical protein